MVKLGICRSDLLVGAYQSGTVMLLRARPIINVTTSLETSQLEGVDPGRAGCPLDPASTNTCFHFSACFRLEEAVAVVTTRRHMAIRSAIFFSHIVFISKFVHC